MQKLYVDPLPVRIWHWINALGFVLLILSGDDLTAREFETFAAQSGRWRRALADPRVTRADIAGADHTFSSEAWKSAVAERTVAWMRRLSDGT